MTHRHTRTALVALLVTVSGWPAASAAQTHRVTLTEGTNMAAALSPDGTELAIDLVGRIWLVPVEGGEAVPLLDELWDARQPTWAPDGSRIAFQGYRTGNYHIYTADRDGRTEQLTHGPFDHREPHWSPDGRRIAFSSDREGSYDIYSLDLATGNVERLTADSGHEWGPAWSPDGESLAYAVQGATTGVAVREVADRAGRSVVLTTRGTPQGVAWSASGRELTYTLLGPGRAELMRHDLSASDAALVQGRDVFPFRASHRSDGSMIYTADGRIVLRSSDGSEETIEFRGTVPLQRPSYRRAHRNWDPEGPMPVRGIKSPRVSPDGSRVAFAAAGDLWIREADGSATRVTDDPYLDADPAWSRDGTHLVFSSDRNGSMDLWIRELASGSERRLTDEPLAEVSPVWSPDDARIAFVTKGGITDPGFVKVVEVASGEVTTLTPNLFNAGHPTWSADGDWLLASVLNPHSGRFREGVNALARIDARKGGMEWTGDFEHVSIGTRGTDGPVWSPDGQWVAYALDGLLWIRPVNARGEAVGPARRMTNEPADAMTWTGDSKALVYVASERLMKVDLDGGATSELPMELNWERHVPTGRTVVHAGRLFDGVGQTLQREVDVIIEGHRIVAVRDHAPSQHTGQVIDAGDGVVTPGLIEMHGHQSELGEALGRQWLSWGVTTVRDPASDPYESLERREAVESGRRPGPRTYNAGYMFDGARIYYTFDMQLRTAAQVEAELDRAQALGYDMVKTYVRLPDPLQKQVVEGAHARGMWVSSHEIYPSVSYGGDGVEHLQGTSRRGYSPKITHLRSSYGDIIRLLAESGMTLTPTMALSGGFRALMARNSERYLTDPRVRAFEPVLAGAASEFVQNDPEAVARGERLLDNMQRTVRTVVEQGGRVIAGTDAPILPRGLSLHMELEAYVDGGLTPLQALQAAGVHAAEALGATGELGVIRPGALADLVVLDGDPLADIEQTRAVRGVMKNGEYRTLENLLQRPVPPFGN